MATKACCKLLCLLIFFAYVTQGCEQSSLTLKQSKTGKMVKNKPEWEVKLTNPCSCVFVDTTLSCVGFKSVTTIDPMVMSKSGDLCLINYGNSIEYGDFVFKYVWDTSFDLKIAETTMACS